MDLAKTVILESMAQSELRLAAMDVAVGSGKDELVTAAYEYCFPAYQLWESMSLEQEQEGQRLLMSTGTHLRPTATMFDLVYEVVVREDVSHQVCPASQLSLDGVLIHSSCMSRPCCRMELWSTMHSRVDLQLQQAS